MAILFLALGSRGDVQPLAALAGELARRGTPTKVVAVREYRDLVEQRGATFVPIDASVTDVVTRSRKHRRLLAHPAGQGWLLRSWVNDVRRPFVDGVTGAAEQGDVIVSGTLAATAGASLAEATGGSPVLALFTPQYPTAHRESHFFERWFARSRAYNAWGTRLNWRVSTGLGQGLARSLREELGLPALGGGQLVARLDEHPIMLAASPLLVPPAPDWPGHHHQTGFIPDTIDAPLAADLAAFVSEGAVFVGVGSFTDATGEEGLEMLARTAELTGRRLVTMAPSTGIAGRVTGRLYACRDVAHQPLFTSVDGIIHHGGAGTTHTALRAGRPTVAVPFGVDQPYHAARLHRMGLGPRPVPFSSLTPDRLATLVDDLVANPASPGYEACATEIGHRARAEDGLQRAVELIEEQAG